MPALQIDFKIDKIIKEIQEKVKDSTGKELNYETIVNVLSAQIAATVNGMANGHTIVWKRFGTFVATKRRVDALNKKYITEGKTPTLVDTGLTRISFNRSGEQTGKIDLLFPQSKKDILEVPEKYRNEGQ